MQQNSEKKKRKLMQPECNYPELILHKNCVEQKGLSATEIKMPIINCN